MPSIRAHQYGGSDKGDFGFTWYGQRFIAAIEQAEYDTANTIANFAYNRMSDLVLVRTGELQESLYANVRETIHGNIVIDFGATAHHAIFNEFGTVKWPGKSFIRPTIDAIVPFFTSIFEANAKKNINEAGRGL
jgi:hypothetical protein